MGEAARRPNPGVFFICMKINGSVHDLDKEGVREKFYETGLIHRHSNDPIWKRAFKLFSEASGQKVDLGCARCFTMVKQWLEKP
jgi:hypothetical protein